MMEKRLAADWGLSIDAILRDFLPRDPQKVKMLEGQILEEGCRDALVVWKEKNCIVDGNTRYDICKANNIPFAVEYRSFSKRSEAMQWAWYNQDNRRNMSKPELIEATHKIEDEIRAEAKERQRTSTGGAKPQLMPNLAQAEKGTSRDKLANMAGVGHTTYQKGTHILDNAPEPIKKAWKSEALTTEAAYQATKLPEEAKQEVTDRIERGEKPKEVVREVINRGKEDNEVEAATIPVVEKSDSGGKDPFDVGPSTYNIDDLVEEVNENGADYLRGLRTLIEVRFPQFDNAPNRMKVLKAIDIIIDGFKRLKEDIR